MSQRSQVEAAGIPTTTARSTRLRESRTRGQRCKRERGSQPQEVENTTTCTSWPLILWNKKESNQKTAFHSSTAEGHTMAPNVGPTRRTGTTRTRMRRRRTTTMTTTRRRGMTTTIFFLDLSTKFIDFFGFVDTFFRPASKSVSWLVSHSFGFPISGRTGDNAPGMMRKVKGENWKVKSEKREA